MKMHVATGWFDKPEAIEVINPYDSSAVDTVPRSDLKDVETAVAAAVRGAKIMAQMTGDERYRLLHRAAELMAEILGILGNRLFLSARRSRRAVARNTTKTAILPKESMAIAVHVPI
jgi:acyl-CoA reductase-like NAD-dependent aldehyde dehydrogenase